MIGIEPASLSTAPVGTEGGDQRVWRFVLVSDGKSTLGDNGGVQQAERSSQDRGMQTDRVRVGQEARVTVELR